MNDLFSLVSVHPSVTRALEDFSPERDYHSTSGADLSVAATLFSVVALLLVCLCLMCICLVREMLWHYFDIPCFRASSQRGFPEEDMDVEANVGIAITHLSFLGLSSEDEDASRERRILRKRAYRRSWYEYSLKPFTQVVSEEDIIDPRGINKENDDFETSLSLWVACKAKPRRVVDGSCAICICDYEVANKVVQSPLEECPHVFHEECVLQWLEKGKKRCPICRQWFVPGDRISDQMAAEHGHSESGV